MSDVLCAFLTFTIGTYGMTIRDYMLTQIAISVISNVAWEDSGFERMLFSDGMGGTEVVLSEPECQSSPPVALGVDGSGKEKAQDRRVLRQGVVEPAIEAW